MKEKMQIGIRHELFMVYRNSPTPNSWEAYAKLALGFCWCVCYIVNYAKVYIWLFSILKTVQPEDLTNQTRVLESIERVLESLTEKTSN